MTNLLRRAGPSAHRLGLGTGAGLVNRPWKFVIPPPGGRVSLFKEMGMVKMRE